MNEIYWQERWENGQTGWDIGYASPPIAEYVNQLSDKYQKILIPGVGNGYEAIYLKENGFKNVYVIDLAQKPLDNIKERFPDFPDDHLIHGDFFEHEDQYDLILEQTFFCALDPGLRSDYKNKMLGLLNPGGKLTGLWFTFPLTDQGPPFGGSPQEYHNLFKNDFNIKVAEPCYNSIPPRMGNEFFMILQRPTH
ncbi:SAM-dependent methyltransferase [Flammeovirgaceae bacterium KN852]|uniref:SAM-dependent methyltransferase n=2 Tax=Marinigracilibium pacificum TaxID=2729599 RepID=A0A848J1B4_9BACT|nr:SAM-dependent methyltransferase [Marinigracilibium pacificum]